MTEVEKTGAPQTARALAQEKHGDGDVLARGDRVPQDNGSTAHTTCGTALFHTGERICDFQLQLGEN